MTDFLILLYPIVGMFVSGVFYKFVIQDNPTDDVTGGAGFFIWTVIIVSVFWPVFAGALMVKIKVAEND